MDFLLYESKKKEKQVHSNDECNHVLINNKCNLCGECITNLDKTYDEMTLISSNTVLNNLMENTFNGSFINSTYFNNLNKWTIWEQNYKDKCLLNMIYFIKDKCMGKIPNIVIDSAIIIIRKINLVKHKSGPLKNKYIIKRGNNKLSLIAICLFESSLLTSYPLTYEEISQMFNLDVVYLYRGDKIYKQLQKQIQKETNLDITKISLNFIRRFCNQFEYEQNVLELACRVNANLSEIEQEIITNIPAIRAICCIYIAMLDLNLDKDKNIRKQLQNQYIHIFNSSLLLKSFKNIKKMKNILISNYLIQIWKESCEEIRKQKKGI